MVKGLYTSLFGMRPMMDKQDILSNNLANVNTSGYKKSDLFVRAYVDFVNTDEQKLFMNDNIRVDEVKIDFQQGPLIQTSNSLDLAIKGHGFFMVETPKGPAYTRNGSFTLNQDGYIVNHHGQRVLAEDGPIQVHGTQITVSQDGHVAVDGKYVCKLKILDFNEPYQLEKTGQSQFKPINEAAAKPAENFEISQGFLEGSNVNTVETMVKMMTAFRNFEADQRSIHAIDETLEKAVNEVGRVR